MTQPRRRKVVCTVVEISSFVFAESYCSRRVAPYLDDARNPGREISRPLVSFWNLPPFPHRQCSPPPHQVRFRTSKVSADLVSSLPCSSFNSLGSRSSVLTYAFIYNLWFASPSIVSRTWVLIPFSNQTVIYSSCTVAPRLPQAQLAARSIPCRPWWDCSVACSAGNQNLESQDCHTVPLESPETCLCIVLLRNSTRLLLCTCQGRVFCILAVSWKQLLVSLIVTTWRKCCFTGKRCRGLPT
ncbi:hypothetical protein VTI74DRAFT_10163 [Chaetomium olivicolor]